MASGWLAVGEELVDPLMTIWNSIIKAIPGMLFAVILLILGYFIAWVLGVITLKILRHAKLDPWMTKHKINDSMGKVELSSAISTLVRWYVFLLFLAVAAQHLEMGTISDFIIRFVSWLPRLFVGLILVVFGLIAGDFVYDRLKKTKIGGIDTIAFIAKVAVILFLFLVGIKQIGVDISLAENVVYILVGAIALALALIIGIGFGWAVKDEAKDMVKTLKKKL